MVRKSEQGTTLFASMRKERVRSSAAAPPSGPYIRLFSMQDEGAWVVHGALQCSDLYDIAACRYLVDCFIPTASDLGAERTDFMQQLGLEAVSASVEQ